MAYRGADLDLRTARTFSATSTDLMGGFDDPPARAEQGEAALWVDDTLLACANQAYDIAAAHRAREVRLDHLVHAFTRSEAAAAELQARGVHVAALRRDSAIAVANEIASAPPQDSETPHPSSELEEVLRLAVSDAGGASRPAGVGDVLHVLIDLRSDAPGSALLLRHSPRATGREFWSTLVSTRPPRSSSAARSAESNEPARVQAPAAAAQPAMSPAMPPAPAEQRRPAEFTIVQGMLDRLSEIERAMSERLEAVEVTLGNVVPARVDIDAVAQRVDAIEHSSRASNGGGELNDRLAALEHQLAEERAERIETLSSLSSDVKALVSALGATPGTNQPSIVERLQILAEDIDQHRDGIGAHFGDRLAAIEHGLEQQAEKLAGDLGEVNESVTKLGVNQQLLAGSMDQWRSNDAGEIHLINSRLGAVQEDGTKRLKMLERLSADIEALSQLALEEQKPGESNPKSEGSLRDPLRFRQWLLGTEDWVKASWAKRPGSSWLKR